jgi:hypothetical protein
MILTALTGKEVTPAQLLGEEAVNVEDRTAEAAQKLKKLQKKMKKAGL